MASVRTTNDSARWRRTLRMMATAMRSLVRSPRVTSRMVRTSTAAPPVELPRDLARGTFAILLRIAQERRSRPNKVQDGLILLHHKFLRRFFARNLVRQHGHRGRVCTIAAVKRMRMVATELGT